MTKEITKPPISNKTQWFKKLLRFILYSALALVALFIVLILLLRTPSVQQWITNKAIDYISEEAGTQSNIDRFYLSFSGNLVMEGFYLADQNGDTLAYAGLLEAGISPRLLWSRELKITPLKLDDWVLKIYRDIDGRFNFDFLSEAFVLQNTEEETAVQDSKPWEINLSRMAMSNFRLEYLDSYLGVEAITELNYFELAPEPFSSDNLPTSIRKLFIEGLKAELILTEPSEIFKQSIADQLIPENEDDIALPKLFINSLRITALDLNLEDRRNDQDLELLLPQLELSNFSLVPALLEDEQNLLSVDALVSNGLHLNYTFTKKLGEEQIAVDEVVPPASFSWPDWELNISSVLLTEYQISYFERQNKEKKPVEFDAENIHIKLDSLYLPTFILKDKTVEAKINQISLSDHSGLEVVHFYLNLSIDDQKIRALEVELSTGKSIFEGEVEITYDNLNQLIQQPESAMIDARVSKLKLSLQDVLVFQKDLRDNEFFRQALPYPIKIQGTFRGNVQELKLDEFKASALRQTRLQLNGSIKDLLAETGPSFNFPFINFYSTEKDLLPYVSLPEGYQLPARLWVNGKIVGSLNDLKTNLQLRIPEGSLSAEAVVENLNETPVYHLDLVIDHLNSAIYTDSLGPEMISGRIELTGKGFDLNTAELELNANLDSLLYKEKRLAPLMIEMTLVNGKMELDAQAKASDLNLQIKGNGKIDSLFYETEIVVSVEQLDLLEWEITEDSILADATFFFHIKSEGEQINARLELDTLLLQKTEESYLLDHLIAEIDFGPDHTTAGIDSRLLKLKLEANSSPDKIYSGINDYIITYWGDQETDSIQTEDLEVYLDISIAESEMLMEVLLPGLTELDEAHLQLQFIQRENSIAGMWIAPYIVYEGIEIRDAYAGISSDKNILDWEVGFNRIDYGDYNLAPGKISGIFSDEVLYVETDLVSEDMNQLILVGLEARYESDTLNIRLNPDKLVFNEYQWSIHSDNAIYLASDYLIIENFELNRGQHRFSLYSHPGNRNDFLKVVLENIEIEGLLSFINQDQIIASGILTGDIEIEEIFDFPLVSGSIEIEELTAFEKTFGNFLFELENYLNSEYNFSASLVGEEAEITSIGAFFLGEQDGGVYSADIQIERLNFSLIEWLTEGELINTDGHLDGMVKIEGGEEELNYSGQIRFNDVLFTMKETGSEFSIPNENIEFSQTDITFKDFHIMDSENKPTTIDGNIDISELSRPEFDLKILSRDFRFLESTREDNDFIYGTAILDLDISLTGDLNTPVIEASFFLKAGSAITMIVPETQVDIIEREGVVVIQKREDGIVVEEATEKEELIAPFFTGVDMQSIIRIHPEAILRIVIDERAGDMLEAAGTANLSFNIDPQGRMYLSGIYELNRGFYEMRMYDIVRRRFDLISGSRMIWSGDPMEAEMQIQAIYRLRTSPLDLMAGQLAGADQITRNQYRQELPFEVIMNLGGKMLQPDLSFKLDMPEQNRQVLGGNVYRRLNQLNNSESELNTQVFSLLVLGRFLSDGLMAEESRGLQPEAMARSSASRLLTSQLNALSDRYVRGVDLDFDLESFTDYRSGMPEDRTQLSLRMQRTLLDDRLSVQVSGQLDLEGAETEEARNGTDILGDVSIEYRLTEDGRWALRGFRKNQYEGILEGQVIVTGFSLLFNRDFNSFAELFSSK